MCYRLAMDLVIHNARVMTCDPARPGLGLIDHGAVGVTGYADGAGTRFEITWVGEDADRPRAREEIDAKGQLVTPGLVDCHTHAAFAGDRAHEFALRSEGKGYVAIQAAGGGIMATLGATRAANNDELRRALGARLDAALAGGTTTVEVKSGYDLTASGEIRLLRNIGSLCCGRRQGYVSTLLAHLVPPERASDRDAFMREICDQWIPAAARDRWAPSSVDVWCESTAFTLAETRQIFDAARQHGLAVRGHIGQLSDLGAAELLAEYGALSADHLEYVSNAGIAALARAGTVAVMLPGACVQLRLPVPPVEKLRAAGVAMAVATDLNPGSSYCETLPIQMWLATTHFGMTVEEAWLGVTRYAAHALRVPAGVLAPGMRADLVVWRCEQPAEVPYRYGANLVDTVYVAGEPATASGANSLR
jgi:imidazolonepropionase